MNISGTPQQIVKLIRRLYGREIPVNPYEWHRWHRLLIPVRTREGTWALDTWRRRKKDDSGWEYDPRKETGEEWDCRQW